MKKVYKSFGDLFGELYGIKPRKNPAPVRYFKPERKEGFNHDANKAITRK